jgi:hypothetical protein
VEKEGRTTPRTGSSSFTEVTLLIKRTRKLAGTEANPGDGTERQLESIQRKLRKEIEKTKTKQS